MGILILVLVMTGTLFSGTAISIDSDKVEARGSTVPGPPIRLDFDIYNEYIELKWRAPEDNGGLEITEFRIYRNNNGGEFKLIYIMSGSELFHYSYEYNDETVNWGSTYNYMVTTVNEAGESDGALTGDIQYFDLPDGVEELTVKFRDGSAILDWKPPAEDGGSPIIHYNIYRDDRSHYYGRWADKEYLIASQYPTNTSFHDSLISEGSMYWYCVAPVNTKGESDEKSVNANIYIPYEHEYERPLSINLHVKYKTESYSYEDEVDRWVDLSWELNMDPDGSGSLIANEDNIVTEIYRSVDGGDFKLVDWSSYRFDYDFQDDYYHEDYDIDKDKVYRYYIELNCSYWEPLRSNTLVIDTHPAPGYKTEILLIAIPLSFLFIIGWWVIIYFIFKRRSEGEGYRPPQGIGIAPPVKKTNPLIYRPGMTSEKRSNGSIESPPHEKETTPGDRSPPNKG